MSSARRVDVPVRGQRLEQLRQVLSDHAGRQRDLAALARSLQRDADALGQRDDGVHALDAAEAVQGLVAERGGAHRRADGQVGHRQGVETLAAGGVQGRQQDPGAGEQGGGQQHRHAFGGGPAGLAGQSVGGQLADRVRGCRAAAC